MMGLQDRIAVVTGSARGIGAASARALAAKGAHVVVNYLRSEDHAASVVAAIRDNGGSAAAVQADVSRPNGVETLFDAVRRTHGTLDILVNNAGPLFPATLADITPAIIDATVDSNYKSAALCTQNAATLFPARGGVVINISSETTRHVLPGSAVFASIKAAGEVLTRYLADELGPRGIRVVGVSPGYTVTPATAGLPPEIVEHLVSRTALRRAGTAEDIAAIVAFLASDEGGWITGTTIEASGGLRF